MIIDTHTYLGRSERFGVISDTKDYFNKFKDIKFVTIPFESKDNEKVHKIVAENDVFAGMYLMFDPATDKASEIDRLCDMKHVVGLKSLPSFYKTPLNSTKYFEFYKTAVKHNLPVLLHCSSSGEDYSSAKMVDEVCSRFCELKLILAHFGGLKLEYMTRAVELLDKHKNIYLNTTALDPKRTKRQVCNESFTRTVKSVAVSREDTLKVFNKGLKHKERILAGSDLGYYPPEEYSLWPVSEMDTNTQNIIFLDNPKRLFGARLK